MLPFGDRLVEMAGVVREHVEFARHAGGLMGEGTPSPLNVPGRAPAMLCLHGFGCVPSEVELLCELGSRLGLRAFAPLLPGHGTHVRDLARTRYRDWYVACERDLLTLSKLGPVIVGGQSTGALIALQLAATHPERVRGVVALAPAVRLSSPFPAWPLAIAGRLPMGAWALPKFGGPNIEDPVARREHLTYSSQPILAAYSLHRAGYVVEKLLPRVGCPTFIAQGAKDKTTPPSNAWRVARQLGTQDVEVHLFARSAHILTKDLDRAELGQHLEAFIRRVAGVTK